MIVKRVSSMETDHFIIRFPTYVIPFQELNSLKRSTRFTSENALKLYVSGCINIDRYGLIINLNCV